MIKLVDDALEQYAMTHSTPVPELLNQLREYTLANVDMPQMQVGPLEGAFLKVLARITGARRVVEVGTFTGYSALMIASGMVDDGELITCELNPDNAAVARSFFDRSPHGKKIRIALGPAAESIADISGPLDMAFIDADKAGYRTYFDMLLPKMRKGGVIACDNVLWSGRVTEPEDKWDDSTRALVEFSNHLSSLKELDKVMVTIRDGITLVVA